jgi:hypothetical protein
MHNVDEVLGDLDLNIPARVRAAHWLNPINPAAYRRVTPKLIRRLRETAHELGDNAQVAESPAAKPRLTDPWPRDSSNAA